MARLMSSTELHQRMETEEDFLLIDVNDPDQFQEEHIPGAINIPLTELPSRARKDLSKNQRIVVYGANHEAERSTQAADLLEEVGFRKVSDFDGGLDAWKRAGYQTAGKKPEVVGEIAPPS
ncbi:MAG: rhodanese-like domain-containing protein [Bradymonadaceae bacterium]